LELTANRQAQPIVQERKVFSWTYELLDPGAKMEFIFRHHFQHLNFLSGRIVYSATESEDIVMNVIYKVATSPRQPQTHDHLKRRLYVSVRNEAISYLRHRRQHKNTLSHLSYLHQNPQYPSLRPQHQDREKFLLLLLQEIRRLSPQRQKILMLYFFANKNTREIAKELSISIQTVLNHKARAIRDLQNSGLREVWRRMFES
jgi:RNA polymerase sigma factor (sigma-70 family)